MLTTKALALSSYEGWVAWVDGIPIFEKFDTAPRRIKLIPGATDGDQRAAARNCMEWPDLPHDKVQRVELYFDRAQRHLEQPRLSLMKEPGADLRFFQMKMSGVVVQTYGFKNKVPEAKLSSNELHREGYPMGQHRLGIIGYRIGYWNRRAEFAEMWEVVRGQIRTRLPPVAHPCWPAPHGYGLAPRVVGLTEAPPLPKEGVALVGK